MLHFSLSAGLLFSFCAAFGQWTFSQAAIDSALNVKLRNIERAYGIQIRCYQNENRSKPPPSQSFFTCDSISREHFENRDRLLLLFVKEWEKYPREFVKKSEVKTIFFVTHLTVNGQRRFAMPDSDSKALFYDVTYARLNDEYLQHCLHHEFYHLIQFTHFGGYYYRDPTWLSFNPSEFSYGSGGYTAYDKPDFANQKHPFKGFVTGYATSGLEEDMAELFAYLMTTSEFHLLTRWKKEDIILLNKVNYLLRIIEKQCSALNLYYLNKLHGEKTTGNGQ